MRLGAMVFWLGFFLVSTSGSDVKALDNKTVTALKGKDGLWTFLPPSTEKDWHEAVEKYFGVADYHEIAGKHLKELEQSFSEISGSVHLGFELPMQKAAANDDYCLITAVGASRLEPKKIRVELNYDIKSGWRPPKALRKEDIGTDPVIVSQLSGGTVKKTDSAIGFIYLSRTCDFQIALSRRGVVKTNKKNEKGVARVKYVFSDKGIAPLSSDLTDEDSVAGLNADKVYTVTSQLLRKRFLLVKWMLPNDHPCNESQTFFEIGTHKITYLATVADGCE